ncbi:MAG: DinB family protein [Acidimicrobiales bacterium]
MDTNTMHDPDLNFAESGRCDHCGFRPDQVPPTDIAVALRSFPRRFRAVLSPADETDAERMARPPASGGWSALQHAGHVRDVLHALDLRLQRVLREDEPHLGETPATPPPAGGEAIEATLAALQSNAEQLATTVTGVKGEEWNRTGRRDGETVSALDLAREAVHEGSHHLRDATRVIEEIRQSPG